jgi:Fe-S oxidoreductase
VVLYLDLFARENGPEIAQAAWDVLEHCGFEVLIPEAPWSNFPLLAGGDVPRARAHLRRVTEALAPYAVRGLPILTPEPTAALCLREEYLRFSAEPSVRLVAGETRELSSFLMDLAAARRLPGKFHELEVSVAYHQPCHQRALGVGAPGLELLRLIPGLRVRALEQSCCGLAGTFGLQAANRETSLAIGKKLFDELRKPEYHCGSSECSSCKMQLEYGAAKPVWHPVQFLAAAYGYEPARPKSYALEALDKK